MTPRTTLARATLAIAVLLAACGGPTEKAEETSSVEQAGTVAAAPPHAPATASGAARA